MRTSNTIIALILLALAVAGVWRWYEAQSKNQKMETAAQDVRETAECHLEAFKLRPGLTETDLEVQAAFMDICMEARGYLFLPSCTPNAVGYKFNSLCWRKNWSMNEWSPRLDDDWDLIVVAVAEPVKVAWWPG